MRLVKFLLRSIFLGLTILKSIEFDSVYAYLFVLGTFASLTLFDRGSTIIKNPQYITDTHRTIIECIILWIDICLNSMYGIQIILFFRFVDVYFALSVIWKIFPHVTKAFFERKDSTIILEQITKKKPQFED